MKKLLFILLSRLLFSAPLQAYEIKQQGTAPTCVPTATYNALINSTSYIAPDYSYILSLFNTTQQGTNMAEITRVMKSINIECYESFIGGDIEYMMEELENNFIIVSIDLTNIAQYEFIGLPYHCVVVTNIEDGVVETLDSNSLNPLYYSIDDFMGAIEGNCYIISK
ncbi:MAG: hypothetical protein ACRCX8_14215 [Sarcina sp.]